MYKKKGMIGEEKKCYLSIWKEDWWNCHEIIDIYISTLWRLEGNDKTATITFFIWQRNKGYKCYFELMI